MWLYLCIYNCIFVRKFVRKKYIVYISVQTYKQTSMYISLICMYVCTQYVDVCMFVYVLVCMYVGVSVSMYLCLHVCMYATEEAKESFLSSVILLIIYIASANSLQMLSVGIRKCHSTKTLLPRLLSDSTGLLTAPRSSVSRVRRHRRFWGSGPWDPT